MDNYQEFYEKWSLKSLFKRRTDKEKLEKMIKKCDESFGLLAEEAGDEKNLRKGIKLGYNNFGKFSSSSYKLVEYIKNNVEEKGLVGYEENNLYLSILKSLKILVDRVKYVKGVSEHSVEEMKWAKRNLYSIIESLEPLKDD